VGDSEDRYYCEISHYDHKTGQMEMWAGMRAPRPKAALPLDDRRVDAGWLVELKDQLESTLQQILDRLDELEDNLSRNSGD
jgi:hypothetical protein